MTMRQCKKIFKSEYLDTIKKHHNDVILLNEAWQMFLDVLCRDNQIAQKQFENADNLFKRRKKKCGWQDGV